MNLSFKDRIAVYYMIATGIVVTIVFLIIYFIVQGTVYVNLDYELKYEATRHIGEIQFAEDSIFFFDKDEWEEKEHREVQVHPVFIQVINAQGKLMDRSPNLRDSELAFDPNNVQAEHFDATLNGREIRQVQVPIIRDDKVRGYMISAMALEDSKMVISNLRTVLLILFPIVLVALFIITRYLAGKSIIPVQRITATADRITRNKLNERIELPSNKDELYTLTTSINELLQRMEEAMERERQFTSDASHQLRTPLAILKGTLEVLNRKARSEAEYKEKIAYSIEEIDRMSHTVNQLLLLARFEKNHKDIEYTSFFLLPLIDDIVERYHTLAEEKKIAVNIVGDRDVEITSDLYYMDLILDNLINNALKYARNNTNVQIEIQRKQNGIFCTIKDQGIGISETELENIFRPFYRAHAQQHQQIPGTGLGLSIVKKTCNLLGIELAIQSELNKGTSVQLAL